MKDDHTRGAVSKVDITDEEEIEGAKIQILDRDGEIQKVQMKEERPVGCLRVNKTDAENGRLYRAWSLKSVIR